MENKARFVHKIFSSVADRYNLMNDIMSFGLHRKWKKIMSDALPAMSSTSRLIDVAGGTADIAMRAARQHKMIDVTVCDINYSMLTNGRDNALDNNMLQLKWVCADAQQLPFPDDYFDCYTIAFGIRNVSDRAQSLAEAYRVLKKGGKFLCLEFSPLKKDCTIGKLYDIHSFKVIPKIGWLVADNEEAYQYLVESIRLFPDPVSFSEEIQLAKFGKVQFEQMSFGVVSLHSAWKF